MRTRYIEKGEINGIGWERTRATGSVTKLKRRAQVKEGLPNEKLAIPLLSGRKSVMCKRRSNVFYLNFVEGVAGMLVNNTFFTRETTKVTIQASV